MHLHHQLLLLDLDPGTGTRRIKDTTLMSYALGAAFFADLQLCGRMIPTGADAFAIQESVAVPSGALGLADSFCTGYRPMSEQRWVSRLGNRAGKLRWAALEELEALGAVTRERDVFLLIPWRTRWPETDGHAERTVQEHLRHWLATVQPADPPGPDDLLLSLLRCTKLHQVVWSEAELAHRTDLIEERTKRAPVGLVAKKASDAAKAAAAAAVAAGT